MTDDVLHYDALGEPVGTAVLLPGRFPQYSALLLGFAAHALTQHGWDVDQLWWSAPSRSDELEYAWVRDHLAAAAPSSGRVLAVGKSLGTLAAPLAAERAYDAIWFTPLLTEDRVVAGLTANPGRQLLVGGLRDEAWVTRTARELTGQGCEVLEIPDADHGLLVPGDVVRGAEIQLEIVRVIHAFLSE